jgi:RHS repeat-associated protein
VTTDFYYSSSWQVLEERVGGQTTVQYVWSPVYVDALILRDRDTDADGTLDERLWVVQDANFNVTAVVDDSGEVVERYIYDPFGQATVLDAEWNVRSGGSAYDWLYLHQGGRYDVISGLYHFRFRDYSPTLGRWTSLDPLSYAAGDVNLYRTVFNAPITHTDPSGQFIHIGFVIAGAVIGAAVWAGIAAYRGEDAAAIVRAAATGALTGAVGGLTFGVGLAAGTAIAGAAGITAGSGVAATAVGVATVAVSGAVAGQASRATQNLIDGQPLFDRLGRPVDMAIDAALSIFLFKVGAAEFRQIPPSAMTGLGAFGRTNRTIPASNPLRTTAKERAAIQHLGPCHTCGSTAPKYYADHVPPRGPILAAQCPTCSNRQGGFWAHGQSPLMPNHIWSRRWFEAFWGPIYPIVNEMTAH